jgi:hypothetical protein
MNEMPRQPGKRAAGPSNRGGEETAPSPRGFASQISVANGVPQDGASPVGGYALWPPTPNRGCAVSL